MAKLNLNKKKLINEDNLRAIISYGLGFASRVKTLEDKEIAPFEANKMYLKDSLCIYNDYIYMAKVTNQSATFNENYWTLLNDDITELSKTDIEAMLGLTTEEIETLSKIILDTEVRLDKTWSSSKIYTDIQNAIDTSKAYTLAELGKISGASYKVVSATSEMTDEKIIYLLDNSGVFDMYIVDGGTPVRIGDTTIDLSDYYTKTEIDNDFLKKTDATSTYATKTEVDDKVDKTNILSATSSTATDDNLYSAKVVNSELDKKANDDEVVKKTDIVTIIDNTSTDEQIPSALTVFNEISKLLECKEYTKDLDIDTYEKPFTAHVNSNSGVLGTFPNGFTWGTIIQLPAKDYRCQMFISQNKMYYRTMNNKVWGNWIRVCTTNINDIPVTDISMSSTYTSNANCKYQVVNGICYIDFMSGTYKLTTNVNGVILASGLPIPRTGQTCTTYVPWSCADASKQVIVFVNGHGELILHASVNANATPMFCTFSYPVKVS